MAIRWVAMSPSTTADFLRSTRSVARRLPSSFPWTMTPLAFTLALTCPLGPTVRLLPFSRMLPSTWPSRYRSSLPESSPLMTTDFPICANSPLLGTSMSAISLGSLPLFTEFPDGCTLRRSSRPPRVARPRSSLGVERLILNHPDTRSTPPRVATGLDEIGIWTSTKLYAKMREGQVSERPALLELRQHCGQHQI